MVKRKLRMGMVGGGPGSFIGAIHRMAANLDGQIELVCGAFSSDPQKSKDTGAELYLTENKAYRSFEKMIETERHLPEGERMDFVSIVTPNHLHYAPAMLAMENGFDVVCDKPLAFNVEEAKSLVGKVEETGRLFCVTHNYTGYPMVRQAREMVKRGMLGGVRRVVVEYAQGWLSTLIEATGSKQAGWRTDPAQSGMAGCMGDIGTHAENLAEFISGLEIEELAADLTTFVEGRKLDDDGSVLLRFKGGAKGVLMASQVSVGEENNLRIRIYGEKAGIEWAQIEPNTLYFRELDKPMEILRTGQPHLFDSAKQATRLPGGHPEGYLEGFANLYRDFATAWWQRKAETPVTSLFPTVYDGLRGMHFVEAVVQSSRRNGEWVRLQM